MRFVNQPEINNNRFRLRLQAVNAKNSHLPLFPKIEVHQPVQVAV